MFPLMYKNARRLRLQQSEIDGLQDAIAALWLAVGGATAPRVVSNVGTPQGTLDATVPTICLVSTPEGIQTYRNLGTGINGWES
jgi:hypothetical protein